MNGYRELKLALELFARPPGELAPEQREKLTRTARHQDAIEAKILRSPEAARVIVSSAAISARRVEIAARYPDADALRADLARLGLDESALDAELARELAIEGALDQVASRTPATTEVEAEIFYRVHLSRFERPERRRLRHLLVVFDGGSERQAAEALLARILPRLESEDAFAQAAARHSNCPTGMEGGLLGTLPRGKLYPELDAIAFALPEGGVSGPVATEVGLHLLRCDAIHPPATAPFEEVRAGILSSLDDRRRSEAQKRWIDTLKE